MNPISRARRLPGKKVRSLLAPLLLTGAGLVHAGGFALIEQGAAGMGNAYAGAAAATHDASTVWFNPAGMFELTPREFAIAAHVISVSNDFENRGTTLNPAFGATAADGNFHLAPVAGDTSSDPGGETVIPNIYYSHQFRPNLAFGISVSVPFGSSTDYGRQWVGRYQAVESGVSVIDINPNIAYKLNEKLSVGGGISLQYMEATLANSIDSGATCLGLMSAGAVQLNECIGAGLSTPGNVATDGYAEVTGDSTEITFNLGLLYKPGPSTKIGATYRHGSEHDLEGDAKFTNNAGLQSVLDNNAAVLTAAGIVLFEDTGATALAKLPPSLSLSGSHLISNKVQLLADATWMGWSEFEELRITFDSGQGDSFNTQGWEDVWRISGGINYLHSNKLTLRAGLAYDESPVPNPKLRTARIPGNDRTWIAFGAGYKLDNGIFFDLGYAHLFLDDTPIDNASESTGGTTIRGVYEPSIDLISAQLGWKF